MSHLWPFTWPYLHCLILVSPVLCAPPPPLFLSLSLSSPCPAPQAKVDNEIIDYRDLAAIPRVKAIHDIEYPDMISYKSVSNDPPAVDNKGSRQDRQNPAEVTSSNAPSHIQWHVCVSCIFFSSYLAVLKKVLVKFGDKRFLPGLTTCILMCYWVNTYKTLLLPFSFSQQEMCLKPQR